MEIGHLIEEANIRLQLSSRLEYVNIGLPVMFASWMSLFMLLLSGDVEVNPGPQTIFDIYQGDINKLNVDVIVNAGNLCLIKSISMTFFGFQKISSPHPHILNDQSLRTDQKLFI